MFLDAATANSSPLGPFTIKTVAVSNESIVATATIKGVTTSDAPCTGIRCVDFSGNEKILYVALGKNKCQGYKLINL